MNRCTRRMLCLCFAMLSVSVCVGENKSKQIIPFEDVRYFEKLRWLEYYTASQPCDFYIYFSTPAAETYYKIKLFLKDNLSTFYDIIGGEDSSFFSFDHPDWRLKNYYLPTLGFGKLYENADKVTNINGSEIDGKFVPKDRTHRLGSFEFKTVKEPEQYVGRISLNYNEGGDHFISYSPKTVIFKGDGLFGTEKNEEIAKRLSYD
jgi:hypothetical protein